MSATEFPAGSRAPRGTEARARDVPGLWRDHHENRRVLRALRALIMTDTKTAPAPAAEQPQPSRPRIECVCGSEFCDECSPPFGRVIRTRLSTHLAHLRAADARSARRFEGL